MSLSNDDFQALGLQTDLSRYDNYSGLALLQRSPDEPSQVVSAADELVGLMNVQATKCVSETS